jgi:Protein of unknown function (DUF3592)
MRPQAERIDPSEPHPGGCLGAAVYLILFMAGALVFGKFFLPLIWDVVSASRWPAVTCVIRSSEVEKIHEKNDPKRPVIGYRPEVRYTYRIGESVHKGERIWFEREIFDAEPEAQAVVSRFASGSATCYVKQSDPAQAVLDRGFRPRLLVGLIPLGLAVIGLVGLAGRAVRRAAQADDPRASDGLEEAG